MGLFKYGIHCWIPLNYTCWASKIAHTKNTHCEEKVKASVKYAEVYEG